MEKSGTITLLQQDLEEYYQGTVSDRVRELWDLTYDELKDIILTGSYTLLQ